MHPGSTPAPRDDAGNAVVPPRTRRGTCARCSRAANLKPRGLCRRCYDDPAARAGHPLVLADSGPARRGAMRGTSVRPGPRPLPEPTEAMPGTEEKILVLAARVAAGQQLYHPLDGVRRPAQVASAAARG